MSDEKTPAAGQGSAQPGGGKDPAPTKIGSIGWIDLTIPDAENVRDFYQAVVGWEPAAVEMDGYSDFVVNDAAGRPVGGICHARGGNADQPPVWMIYIHVADLDQSLAAAQARGGVLVTGPKSHGDSSRFAVIRDPAGAFCALYQGPETV
jgi:predicted enzyme related to lactoylglutathione lyase